MERTQKKLTALAGAVLFVAGAVLYLGSRGTDRSTRRVQPDVGGELELVVGYVASARQSALRNAQLVTEVVNGLPAHVDVLLATNDRGAFQVENPWPERVRFVELSPDRAFTIWPQDPFVVLEDVDGSRTLLVSHTFERANDAWFGDELGDAIDWPVRVSDLSFEGGNLVSDEETVFIGVNTILDNAARLGETEPDVLLRFERELGAPVLVIGPAPQPIGHIDMILTPLGGRRVMVADPSFGADVVEEEMARDPDAVARFEKDLEASFFGHPSIRALVNESGETIEPPALEGVTGDAVDASRAIADVLDDVALELTARGYGVTRIPFLFHEAPLEDDTPREGPGYPTLTYNNVLVEAGPKGETVYLPRYGLDALDDAARDVWQGAGFRVQPIDGLTVSAMYGGSLRCCIKVLARRR